MLTLKQRQSPQTWHTQTEPATGQQLGLGRAASRGQLGHVMPPRAHTGQSGETTDRLTRPQPPLRSARSPVNKTRQRNYNGKLK